MRQLRAIWAEESAHEVGSNPASQPENEQQDEAETARQLFLLQIIQAGSGGLDGRFGIDAGAAVCSGVCHEGDGGKTWPTFLVGFLAATVGAGITWVRRSPLRRRQSDRPRASVSARRDLRTDDDLLGGHRP